MSRCRALLGVRPPRGTTPRWGWPTEIGWPILERRDTRGTDAAARVHNEPRLRPGGGRHRQLAASLFAGAHHLESGAGGHASGARAPVVDLTQFWKLAPSLFVAWAAVLELSRNSVQGSCRLVERTPRDVSKCPTAHAGHVGWPGGAQLAQTCRRQLRQIAACVRRTGPLDHQPARLTGAEAPSDARGYSCGDSVPPIRRRGGPHGQELCVDGRLILR